MLEAFYDDEVRPDEDIWERHRIEKMKPVYNLVDLLIKLKVLGPGWDVGLVGIDYTNVYADKYWKV